MKFADQIAKHTKEYERRMTGVFRESAQEVVNRAQTPVSKNGRMRIDTGFLRASGGAGINQMPSGPTSNERGGPASSRVTGMGLTEALGRWKPGDTFFWGWTANYAAIREYKDGFMRGAAEKWDSIVASVARRVGK
ncbi:MAG TPA: hypothetical protein VK971_05170 [Thiohalobacter sp.]|nr:hypothetical protein [Thiohalobacter sp.]